MKITIYNKQYEFSEVLDAEFILEFIPEEFEEFDSLISEITPDHQFAYGWLESMYQSYIADLFTYTDFTHIKFER